MRPAKIVTKEKNLSETIKLFDFEKSEIERNFVNTDDQGQPLDQPKLYLNMLYHDKVLPPMKRDRSPADPKNDKEWGIIPVSFAPNKERWSASGMKCIHIDAHVNTCVFEMFKTSNQKILALTNYFI